VELQTFEELLNKTLSKKYSYEKVELGENWHLIAQIFFDLGVESVLFKNETCESP
jgi:hypothetical protein